MKHIWTSIRLLALGLVLLSISSCQPNVYGSIGVSSWGGGGGPRVHGNVSVGGRICC